MELYQFNKITNQIRRDIIDYCYKTKSTHIASNFSIVEMLTLLYHDHLNVSPNKKYDKERDRFILSKGHACLALYIILEKMGFIQKDILNSFAVNGGMLEHHPRRLLDMGIEVSSGSLGHGLSIGTGMALAAKHDRSISKVYVLMSDGEMNEGSIWEAIMFAGHNGLNNLIAIVDNNKMQALGKTKSVLDLEPLKDKFKSFRWNVHDINGHDFYEINDALKSASTSKDRPSVIISNTIKGKGVSFMEMNLLWHYRTPNDEEYKLAMEELKKK